MKVIVLSGIPGSGKTTYVKSLLAGNHNLNVVVCSADDHFMVEGEYKFDVTKLGSAHGACLVKFTKAISESTYPQVDYLIVDNTSTTPIECAPYVALALAYNVDVEIVQFSCPPEIGFMRNTHGVPLKGCYQSRDNLENFQKDMPIFWKFGGVKLTTVNTWHTATDIANARILARKACEADSATMAYVVGTPDQPGINPNWE
ncbi:AAA domain containing protein [uncultured Caudovirales phage]|uniref:AAA domain containing protein n=1 Tax=uncultured Caudovirales phage TaxID=2100421 RepID=A0A6J5RWJ1_9CAUD|nr:AAA domain containing protein [uncultured Caudovirales phage]